MIFNFQFSLASTCQTEERHWLVGKWKFIGFIYRDEFKLPLTPNLLLTFQFKLNGTSRIYWERTGEPGFCERTGTYSINNNQLFDEVTWVNPANDISCGQDPDMQLGKKSINPISIVESNFHLDVGLAGEPFVYVFERLPSED